MGNARRSRNAADRAVCPFLVGSMRRVRSSADTSPCLVVSGTPIVSRSGAADELRLPPPACARAWMGKCAPDTMRYPLTRLPTFGSAHFSLPSVKPTRLLSNDLHFYPFARGVCPALPIGRSLYSAHSVKSAAWVQLCQFGARSIVINMRSVRSSADGALWPFLLGSTRHAPGFADTSPCFVF